MEFSRFNFQFVLSLIFIVVISSCQHSTNKSDDKIPITSNDTSKSKSINNSGVQKPTSWINDFEHIIDNNSIDTLTFLVNEFEEKTAVTIAVVTTATFSPFNSIEEFSEDLGNKWGIGLKEINNGIMIVVSANQRKVRIFTGLGMDQLLSDDAGIKIVNEQMLPSFQQGNYPVGIKKGVKEIMRVIMLQAVK
ncbi:hypothetical protein LBMAG27_19070 [Bacteroidota bacterium]|nr:hypothetical protein LBMAG27_19070 [Bacteroidota bacterium]